MSSFSLSKHDFEIGRPFLFKFSIYVRKALCYLKCRTPQLHVFSSYKKHLNKKQLVHHLKCKKQRLVDILKSKKQTSIIAPFLKIYKRFFPTFSQNFQSISGTPI